MRNMMITTFLLMMLGVNASASDAPQVPRFIQETFPQHAVGPAFDTFKKIMLHPDSALDAGTRELIALAVSAQVPCDYCVYYHQKAARAHGADESTIKEALAVAALVRKWSTILNGSDYDAQQWRAEVDAMFSGK